jgi:uncharacterized protein YggU (UPF0235/DUF167 family)
VSGAGEARLGIRVTPRGGRDAVEGVRDGLLQVRVAAAPAGGAANAAVLRLVAAALGVPPSSVRVVSGATGRRKVLGIAGIERATLVARWPELGP